MSDSSRDAVWFVYTIIVIMLILMYAGTPADKDE
jgi:hypothetical protein